MTSCVLYVMRDEHEKDNPYTQGGFGKGSVLFTAKPAPKWHSRVLPTKHAEPCKSLPKKRRFTHVPGYRNRTAPLYTLLETVTAPFAKHRHRHSETTILFPKCVGLSFITGQTLRQRLLRAKRPEGKKNTEKEQSVQDKRCC